MNIIIFDKRYIVCKGLATIIKNIDNSLNIIEIDNIIQFQNYIQNTVPDFLFIPIKQIQKIHTQKNISQLQHTQVVVISNKRDKFYGNFFISEQLFMFEGKETITTKLEKLFAGINSDNQELVITNELSKRELEIVKHIAEGNTNQQIATQLFISPHTVITHRKNITRKLGIKTVSGLTIYAILNNLISIK